MSGRRIGAVLAVAVAVIGLAGCAQDNTPDAYDTLTQQNFLELCTNRYYDNTDNTLALTTNTIKADVTALDPTQCQCQYEVFVDQMPINKAAAPAGYTGPNFTDLNSQLKSDPETAWATVPESITAALRDCVSAGSSTSSTSAPAPTTSAAN